MNDEMYSKRKREKKKYFMTANCIKNNMVNDAIPWLDAYAFIT